MANKTAGVGYFQIPTAPAVGTGVTSGAANVFTTTYVQMIASTAAAVYITGVTVQGASTAAPTYVEVQIATGGAGSESIVSIIVLPLMYFVGSSSQTLMAFAPIFPPIPVANATRIACKTADSVGALAWKV